MTETPPKMEIQPVVTKNATKIGFTRNIEKEELDRNENGSLILSETNLKRLCAR